jgi:hypothetical protein
VGNNPANFTDPSGLTASHASMLAGTLGGQTVNLGPAASPIAEGRKAANQLIGILENLSSALAALNGAFTPERPDGMQPTTGAVPVAGVGGLFRGGTSLAARLGVDVRAAADGLIHPLGKNGQPQGLSLNVNPKDPFIQKYGGAFPVDSLPQGLQAVPSGKPGHFVVAPATAMTFEKFQGLLNQIRLGNFNILP